MHINVYFCVKVYIYIFIYLYKIYAYMYVYIFIYIYDNKIFFIIYLFEIHRIHIIESLFT